MDLQKSNALTETATEAKRPSRTLTLFCIFTLLFAVCAPFLPLHGEGRVYDDTLRLHILANSDCEADQAVKLKVRDGILALLAPMLEECKDHDSACRVIEENRDLITDTAKGILRENGFDASADALLGREYYPEREYDGVTLPAGYYTSLRVVLGAGEGHNWWCVLYPTLCTGSAKPEKELKQAGFTPEQIRVLTENEKPRYKVRFKILEFFSGIFG